MWYDPLLRSLIDESTARTSAATVIVHDPDFPHGFVFVEDDSVDQRLANPGNTPIMPAVAASPSVVVDVSMDDLPTPVPDVYSVSLELANVREFLERAGVLSEGVATMEEAVDKLASVVSFHSTGSNSTVSVVALDLSATEWLL